MKTISLCLTNYNRDSMLFESFEHVLKDKRISEIVISDDCSDMNIYNKVKERISKHKKIRLHRNQKNSGMSLNKMRSIAHAKNDYVIVFDSDNVIKSEEYIDPLMEIEWENDTIYMPDFAMPQFDYRKFAGLTLDKNSIKEYLDAPMCDCLLNTCNYFVNAQQYLNTYVYNPDMIASDTIYFNYLWLKSGGKFHIVKGMQYYHRVHDGSGFLEQADYNLKKASEIKQMIKEL